MLLVERAGEPLKGYWSLPGGLVETGERLASAVVREIREETGLRVKPVMMFEIFERILRDARGRTQYHYVLVDYVCRVLNGKLRAGDDVSRAEWVPRKSVPQYTLTEGTAAVIERAFDARRKRTRV